MRVIVTQNSPLCLLFLIVFSACENSTEPAREGWVVSGTTYLLGSANPISDVTIKCAGMTAKSGTDGSYRLEGVPEGKQILTAERQDCDKYIDTVEVKSDTRRYIYLSVRTTKLWGYVTNTIDGPVEGAMVKMQKNGVYTDASGRYELPRIAGMSDTLFVTHPVYLPYSAVVSLDLLEKRVDVTLTRQRMIDVNMTEDSYVDESRPDATYGSSSTLLLSTKVFGVSGYLRHVYLKFNFPEIVRDQRVMLLTGYLQVTMSSPTPPMTIETYSIASPWTAPTITYNIQPTRGPLLEHLTIGNGISGQSWSILTTSAISQLLADWRGNRAFYGVVLQGGPFGVTPCGFYSSEVTAARPKLRLQVQY